MKYIVLIILVLFLVLIKILKSKNKLSNRISAILTIITVTLFLEFSVFNINSYITDFGNYKKINFEGEKLNEVVSLTTDETTQISLSNLNTKVRTVYLELENVTSEDIVEYQICYSDDTTISKNLDTKSYNSDVTKTKYNAIYLSGNAKSITINVFSDSVKISRVVLNAEIPFEFNIVRVLVIIFIALLVYSLKTSSFWNEPYSIKNWKQGLAMLVVVDLAILIVYFFNTYCTYTGTADTDLYNQKLVEALSKGQVSLLDEPKDELLNLNNPYDAVERGSSLQRDKDYIWDAALYNGNYYVYFGILPALILFLPYYLITGNFLATHIGVLIFSELAVLVIFILIEEIIKKYFPKAPFKFMFFSTIMMLFGTMLIWINVAPRFYELVTVAGLFFALLGFLLVFTAEKNSQVSYKKIFFGSLSLALAVACRPTQLFASILIIPIIYKIFKQNIKDKKQIAKLILSVLIPYVTIGIALMWYNYIRFGSIFEFGSSYQLTVNDMRNLGVNFASIPAGLLCDLFNLPSFKAVFPFISANANIISTNSYYYIEDIPGGVFILCPIAFFCFGLIKFAKTTPKKELKNLVISLISVGILLTIFVILQAGSTGRYFLDFAWLFVLAGILIFLELFENYKSEEAKSILTKVFIVICCFTVIINLLLGFCDIGGNGMRNKAPAQYFKVEYGICFWE